MIQAKLLEILSANLKVEHFRILLTIELLLACPAKVLELSVPRQPYMSDMSFPRLPLKAVCFTHFEQHRPMTIAFAFSAIRHLKIFPASNMINKAPQKKSIPNKARNW